MWITISLANENETKAIARVNTLEDCQEILKKVIASDEQGILQFEVEKGLTKPAKYVCDLKEKSIKRILAEIFIYY